MLIVISPDQIKDPGTETPIPPELIQLIASWTEVSYHQYPFGYILRQQYINHYFSVYFNHLQANQSAVLYISNNAPNPVLQVTTAGTMHCTILGDITAQLPAGTFSLFYVPSGMHKMYLNKGITESIHVVFTFKFLKILTKGWDQRKKLFKRLARASQIGKPFKRIQLSADDWEELHNFRNIRAKGRSLNAALNAFLFKIVAQYLDKMEGNQTAPLEQSTQPRTMMESLIKSISIAPSKARHTLEYCAKQCKLSPSAYKEKFQKITQTSHMRYVQQKCMEKAKQLITVHNKSIQEVAEQLGYNHSSNFSRAYKKFWGVYPSKDK